MKNILLVDCSADSKKILSDLLPDSCAFADQNFSDDLKIADVQMIILEEQGSSEKTTSKISFIRKRCSFRAIPIIVIAAQDDPYSSEWLLRAGASEVLTLDAANEGCMQIFQGYLIPNRRPLEKEMAYITPFIESAVTVLKKMALVDASFRDVYFANDLRIYGDISGVIGLSGNSEGTVAITFYWELARNIIANMMKVSEEKINDEFIHDGTGELINMISGSTKKKFKGTPFHFDLSLPTVVVGSGHQLGHPEGASIAVLIFDVEDESLVLQVCLKPKANSGEQGAYPFANLT